MARTQGGEMVRRARKEAKGKPVIGITCEIHKLKPYFSEFELVCDYRYVRAIIRAGGLPVLLPINPVKKDARALIKKIDGIVIVGGADIHPSFYGEKFRHKILPAYRGRTRFDMHLYHLARLRKIPILMICFGMQLLNVIHGGTLYQDIKKQLKNVKNHQSKRNPIHLVHLEEGSDLKRILGRQNFPVHSQHHQAVKRLGHSLRAVGYSPDWIIEAVEGPPQTIAVQWHPERQARDPIQKRLFRHFISLCK